MDQNPARVDVLIGGAGFAGLSLAIALTQPLGPSFSVAVVDPALAGQDKDERASAIAAAARRLFETIGAWEAAGGRAQPSPASRSPIWWKTGISSPRSMPRRARWASSCGRPR